MVSSLQTPESFPRNILIWGEELWGKWDSVLASAIHWLADAGYKVTIVAPPQDCGATRAHLGSFDVPLHARIRVPNLPGVAHSPNMTVVPLIQCVQALDTLAPEDCLLVTLSSEVEAEAENAEISVHRCENGRELQHFCTRVTLAMKSGKGRTSHVVNHRSAPTLVGTR